MSRDDVLFYDPPLYEKYVFEKVIMSLSGCKFLRSHTVIMIYNSSLLLFGFRMRNLETGFLRN